MLAKGMKPADVDKIAPHRVFSGNRPSLTILYRKLDPRTLGRLIALYEHRVFVEGTLFDINSFDQWGVELGKELATGLLPVVEGKENAAKSDASTAGLVAISTRLRGAGVKSLADIKGILFDKDGTLVDFNATWLGIGDMMALEAAGGDRWKADGLLAEAGYDFVDKRFKPDSVFAAGTNMDIVALWFPRLSDEDQMLAVARFNEITSVQGSAHGVALPGTSIR